MSSFAYLSKVQQYLTTYGITTYLVLGNIGCFFNMMVFITPALRRNPSSFYIFAASLCGCLGLNFSVVPLVYGLDHTNPVLVSAVFCKLQFYFRHSFNQLMRTFFIFACIDRFAISSQNVRTRSLSQFRIALVVSATSVIFWFIIAIFPTMFNALENGRCQGVTGVGFFLLTVYIAAAVGIIPVSFMIVFGLLMLKNLKKIRTRVQITTISLSGGFRLHKRDREMMKVLLIEIICNTCMTTPLFVNLIYRAATQAVVKGVNQQQIDSFITYICGTFILYMNNGLPFWIYIIESKSFRLEFKNVIIRFFQFITCKQRQRQIGLVT